MIIVFIIDYFKEKLTWQKFSKIPKNPILGTYSGTFCPNLDQKWILLEKGLCQFFNNRITYHCGKNQKNLMSHSWENWWRDTPKTSIFHWFLCEIQPILESCDWQILQSGWPRAFWAISQVPEFSQIWKNLFKHTRITII